MGKNVFKSRKELAEGWYYFVAIPFILSFPVYLFFAFIENTLIPSEFGILSKVILGLITLVFSFFSIKVFFDYWSELDDNG